MRIEGYVTDEAVLAELGRRLERARLDRNLTQLELAAEAGLQRKVVQRFEAGRPVNLTSLIRLLRALGLIDSLDRLLPEPSPRPIDLLKLQGKARRRASGRRAKREPPAGEPAPWHWGDEAPAPRP